VVHFYIIIHNGFHFNGIRDKYYMINQTGKLRVYGVSFFPAGLYPILKIPISEFSDKTIELDLIIKNFTNSIVSKIKLDDSISDTVAIIEEELANIVDVSLIPTKETQRLFESFHRNNNLKIDSFCNMHGINQRRLERLSKKYIGVSPKAFNRITRFQEIIKLLEINDENFTAITYNNNYYDQNHFIKDFKSFTGTTPTEFLKSKKSIKQITKKL